MLNLPPSKLECNKLISIECNDRKLIVKFSPPNPCCTTDDQSVQYSRLSNPVLRSSFSSGFPSGFRFSSSRFFFSPCSYIHYNYSGVEVTQTFSTRMCMILPVRTWSYLWSSIRSLCESIAELRWPWSLAESSRKIILGVVQRVLEGSSSRRV